MILIVFVRLKKVLIKSKIQIKLFSGTLQLILYNKVVLSAYSTRKITYLVRADKVIILKEE